MTPEEYRRRWIESVLAQGLSESDAEIVCATAQAAQSAGLDEDTKTFLVDYGLPSECAPGLSFDDVAQLPTLDSVFSPGMWPPADAERVASYRMIGSDGAGNPICVDRDSGAVVMLDHEDNFKSKTFVNTSVALLSKSLLALESAGSHFEAVTRIGEIDAAAVQQGSFWVTEDLGFEE